MSDDIRLEIRTVPTLDTGIGRELGYESDAALVDATEAERATWPPILRDAVEKAEAELERRVLFGETAHTTAHTDPEKPA